jgi:hypothetical protein
MSGDPRLKTQAWKRKVAYVVDRDSGICHLCGTLGATSADHLVPRSQGGDDDESNLAAVHVLCNKRRGNRTIEEARRLIGVAGGAPTSTTSVGRIENGPPVWAPPMAGLVGPTVWTAADYERHADTVARADREGHGAAVPQWVRRALTSRR